MYQNVSKCIKRYQKVSKGIKVYVYMILTLPLKFTQISNPYLRNF